MTQLTQFQQELLDQLSLGPAVAVVLTDDPELDTMAGTGLVEVYQLTPATRRSVQAFPAKSLKVVQLTETGAVFCRNTGSNMVN